MASGTLISRFLGFIRTFLVAFILGNGTRQADILSLANTIPTALYTLFAGGALNTVLVPQIVRAIRHDDDGGEAYTNRIITAFMFVIGVVTVIMVLFTPLITWLYVADEWRAPDLTSQYGSMVLMTYLTMPQIFFYGVFYLFGQVLNARDKFGPMMWAPIANNIVSIAVMAMYLVVWGTSGNHAAAFTLQQNLLLGAGATLGIVVQALVLMPYLRKVGFKYRPRFDWRGVGLGHTLHLTKWTLGFVAVNQVVLMVVQRLATSATAEGSGGGVTVYNNAHLMWILPHSLVTVSLVTAMLPSASRFAATGDLDGVAQEARKTLRLSLIALVPATVAFLALAGPMSVLLFGHGQGSRDAVLVAWALMAFATGLIPYTMQAVYLRTFYALEDTRTPFFLQCAIAATNAIVAVILVSLINSPSWTAALLALANAAAYLLGVQLTWRFLRRKVPALEGMETVLHIMRLLIAASVGGVPAWFAADFIMRAIPNGLIGPMVALLVGGGLLLVGYVLVGKLLKVRELRNMTDLLKSRLGRRPAGKPKPEKDEGSIPNEPPVPTISTEAATAAAMVDDLMPTAIHSIIVDSDFNGWDAARLPDHHRRRKPTPAMPPMMHTEFEDSVSTAIRPAAAIQDDEDTDDRSEMPVPDENSLLPQPLPEPSPAPVWEPKLVQAGDLLSTRFRIEEIMAIREGVETWRAHDMVLSRDVVAHVLPADGPRNEELLASARKGATATDARFLRVLDAVNLEGDRRGIGGYVVCEYAAGRSLTELMRFGTFTTLEASWVVYELADALIAPHGQGLFHEHLNPDNVVITTLGAVKIVGFGIEAGLAPSDEARWLDREAADVKGLASLLYAMLVSHWPGSSGWGLPAAPVIAGETAPAHTVAGGVSPVLDRICSAALTQRGAVSDPRITTASQLADRLAEVLGGSDASSNLETRVRLAVENPHQRRHRPPRPVSQPVDDGPPTVVQTAVKAKPAAQAVTAAAKQHPTPAEKPPSSRSGRGVLWFVLVLALAVMVVCLVVVALQGTRQATTPPPSASQTSEATPTPSGDVRAVENVTATSFDPVADNGSGDENPDQAAQAVDGDPATGWSTQRYHNYPDMGREKPGVGLVLDLGEAVPLDSVDVKFTAAGENVELRVPKNKSVASAPMDRQDQWEVVTTAAETGTDVVLKPKNPVTTRFVLVYVTRLPQISEARFQATINEVVVHRT